MLNEEKVKLMTKIAIYEKNQEYKDLAMARYFKEDYVKLNCLTTFISSTFCYVLVAALVIYKDFETIMEQIYEMDYFDVLKKIFIYYIIFVAVTEVVAFLAYTARYYLAKPGLVRFNKNMRLLLELDEPVKKKKRKKKKAKVVKAVQVLDEVGGALDMPENESNQNQEGV